MSILVLYHNNCPDGMAAAITARRFFQEQGHSITYAPIDYGGQVPSLRGVHAVWLLDYCLPAAQLRAMASQVGRVDVIDHHKTTIPVMAEIGGSVPNLTFDFDDNRSGGWLTHARFFPGEMPGRIITYTQDRDLWEWRLPMSKEISAALSALPWSMADWEAAAKVLDSHSVDAEHPMVKDGRVVLAYQDRMIEDHISQANEVEFAGHKVLIANCSAKGITSDLTARLSNGRAFGVTWMLRGDGLIQFSLRSREGGIDVSELARRLGGGGHKQAAGFQVRGDHPPVAALLEAATRKAAAAQNPVGWLTQLCRWIGKKGGGL
jgi:oligoribonuclease NrnB/cAMP/cGMP phosphodiesterase (DHH superfamily)